MFVRILIGDCRDVLRTLPDESVHCVVTSPPYWGLRDYGVEGQIGLEFTMQEHLALLVDVFREMRRVLRSDGTFWLNYGDAYANDGKFGGETGGKQAYLDDASRRRNGREKRSTGLKPKDRMLLPARLALALQDDGWWLRDEIVWHKPNPMPSPGRGRTTPAHEMLYLLTKSARYWFDQEAFQEPANVKDWNDGTRVYGGANKCGANVNHGDRTTGRRTGKIKIPGGWDTGAGGHGTIHRSGRTEAQYVEAACSDVRNRRSVWTIATSPLPAAHFATFPPALIEPCILAGCPAGGTVLDPFFGAGTTGLVADRLQRDCIGIELNADYTSMAERRIRSENALLCDVRVEDHRKPNKDSPVTDDIVAPLS